MATYDTIDKMRRIANDPAAAPAERDYAERKLREYASQPVIYNNKKANFGIRVAERTATIVAEEQDKREAIAARAEDRVRNSVARNIDDRNAWPSHRQSVRRTICSPRSQLESGSGRQSAGLSDQGAHSTSW